MGLFRRRQKAESPTNFWGLNEERLFEAQLTLIDIMEGVGLSAEETGAMTVALKAVIAIRGALKHDGKIDWDVWEEKEEEA